jgi:hypothetical protein
MKKWARIFISLLATLLLCMMGLTFLIQIPYAQKKIIAWFENRMEGQLSIQSFKILFPFWISLEEIHYHTDEMEASCDRLEATLIPATLLWGRLTISDLKIDHGKVISSQKNTLPSFPLPIDIYNAKIASFSSDQGTYRNIKGSATVDKNFYLHLDFETELLPNHSIHVTIDGSPENQSCYLIGRAQNLAIEGTYNFQTQAFSGTFSGKGIKAQGSYDRHSNHVQATGIFWEHPFSLCTQCLFHNEGVTFSDLVLNTGDLDLRGHLTYLREEKTWNGNLSAELAALAPPLGGSVIGNLTVENNHLSFQVDGKDLTWNEFHIPQMTLKGELEKENSFCFSIALPAVTCPHPAYEIFPDLALQFKGHISQDSLEVEGKVWGMGESPLSLFCQLPLHFSLHPFCVALDKETPFTFHLQGRGTIDPLLAFLENVSLIAYGEIDLDLLATGTWNAPELQGHLIYERGWIESLTTGAVFQDIYLDMEGVGEKLHIRSLTAHDGNSGTLIGEGNLVWDPLNHFPFAVQIHATNYQIFTCDPLTAVVDAQIQALGSFHAINLTGSAQLVEGYFAIPSKIPVQIPTVDFCYVHPTLQTDVEPALRKQMIPLYYDILIDAPQRLFIEGRGLESEWKGNLRITGEQNAPCFQGKLRLIQGRFKVINQMFDLIEGKVHIDGLRAEDLFIDLKGVYEFPNMTVSLSVIGSLNERHIAFSSNPPMNTNQILSWILFQQDLNELTPIQACKLASILVSLSGKYTGPKTWDNIKEGLGLDVLSITDCDISTGDLTFQLGKYLSRGTFVGINKSISGNFDSVLIQTRLIRDFYLEANYGGSLNGLTSSGGKITLKWFKSY